MAKKVLVVEDNLLNLKLFCDLLRVHRYDARPVSDGRLAIDEARGFAPDLVIMDIQLPHVSGLELIGAMKADDGLRAIPVMAVTAYAAVGDEDRIRSAGAEAYVSKPISVLRFVEEVRALIGVAEGDELLPRQGKVAAELTEEEDGKASLQTDLRRPPPLSPSAPPSPGGGGMKEAGNDEASPAEGASEAAETVELSPDPRRDDPPA